MLVGIGITGLAAALSFYRPFGWNKVVLFWGHGLKSFRGGWTRKTEHMF
jgi:hypothetical protein